MKLIKNILKVIKNILKVIKDILKSIHIFGKDSGRNLTRDVIVAVLCIALWVSFFVFALTPLGVRFLESTKYYTPFIELFENTLNDLSVFLGRINGLWFREFILAMPANTPDAEYAQFTLATLFFDISKAVLAALFFWVLKLVFSRYLLYGNNHTVSDILNGNIHDALLDQMKPNQSLFNKLQTSDGKTDFLYGLNRILLLGVAYFGGNLLANWLVGWLSNYVFSTCLPILQHLIGLLFAIIVFVVSTLCIFLLRKASFTSTANTSNPFKNVFSEMICEIPSVMITNLFMVLLFNSILVFKLRWPTLIVFVLFLLWTLIAHLFNKLFNKLLNWHVFYVAKKCPLSGIFGVVASVAAISCIYFIVVPGDNLQEMYSYFKSYPPLSESWVHGRSILNELVFRFQHHSGELLILFVTCNIFVVLQHLSSTYTITVWTQIFVRFFLLSASQLVLVLCFWLFGIIWQHISTNWVYVHFVTFALVMGYIIFATLQPYWAMQGAITTGGVIIFLILLPANRLEYNFGQVYMGLGIGVAIAEAVYLLVSFLQNLVAIFEKKHYLASKAIAATVGVAGVGAAAVATANAVKAVSEGTAEVISGVADTVSAPINNYCTKCGNKLSAVDHFCTKCGKKIK